MDSIEMLGIIAGIMTTGSYIPQAIKTIKTKDTSSISLSMYLIMGIGTLLWIIYGSLHQQLAIIAPNVVSCILTSTILGMKLKYK